MSRYISVKWLEDNAKEYSLGYYEEDEWATPLNILDSAPSIEIIRCGECKYWNTSGCREGVGECEWAYYMTKPDDFCSYGEPKEELKGSEGLVKGSEKPNNSKERSSE